MSVEGQQGQCMISMWSSRSGVYPPTEGYAYLDAGSVKDIELASSAAVRSMELKASKKNGHVPRPPNAFIIFRNDYVNKLSKEQRKNNNSSNMAAAAWRDLDPAERTAWFQCAEKYKERHAILNPGYKYRPLRKGAKKVQPSIIAPPPSSQHIVAPQPRRPSPMLLFSPAGSHRSFDGLERRCAPSPLYPASLSSQADSVATLHDSPYQSSESYVGSPADSTSLLSTPASMSLQLPNAQYRRPTPKVYSYHSPDVVRSPEDDINFLPPSDYDYGVTRSSSHLVPHQQQTFRPPSRPCRNETLIPHSILSAVGPSSTTVFEGTCFDITEQFGPVSYELNAALPSVNHGFLPLEYPPERLPAPDHIGGLWGQFAASPSLDEFLNGLPEASPPIPSSYTSYINWDACTPGSSQGDPESSSYSPASLIDQPPMYGSFYYRDFA